MKYIKNLIIVITIVIMGFVADKPETASAIPESIWFPAQNIPFYDDINPPYLVADQNRIVHAFNSQALPDGKPVIYYRQWSKDLGWSRPISILLPDAQLAYVLLDVLLGSDGQFHLIFYGGTEDNGTIEYSHAWASEADRAEAWSDPVELASGAGPVPSANLLSDGISNLYVLYSGQSPTSGVFEIHSDDNGKSWTEPILLHSPTDEELIPLQIGLEADPMGNIHTVWSYVDDQAFGQFVYYAKRDVNSGEWVSPQLLAAREGNDYAAEYPSIIYYRDELIVIYEDGIQPGGVPPTRWMRTSIDGGMTWSSPVQPFPQVGENGLAIMLVDSNNELHIVLSNRVGNPAIYGIWHGTWLAEYWSKLELVTPETSEQAIVSGSYDRVNFASMPQAVISQGNTILVTWWHDTDEVPLAGFTYTTLDAPEFPLQPLPTANPSTQVEVTSTSTVDEEIISTLEPLPTSNPLISDVAKPQTTNPVLFVMVMTIFLIILFIISVIVFRRWSVNRS